MESEKAGDEIDDCSDLVGSDYVGTGTHVVPRAFARFPALVVMVWMLPHPPSCRTRLLPRHEIPF